MNAPFVGTALMAASLRSITSATGTQARAFPRNTQHIHAALQALGRPGMTALRAVHAAASPTADETTGDADASREPAKN